MIPPRRAWARLLAAALLLAGCGTSDPPPDGPGPDGLPPDGALPDAGPVDAGWSTVFEGDDLDRAVLSVWGTAPDEVFFAGGGLQTPGSEGALALRFDGQRFERLDTSAAGSATFWWVHGGPAAGGGRQVWFVGEQGMALRWNGETLERIETGTTATLFGVYVAGPDDVWAVGGTPLGQGDSDVLLHYTGGPGFEAVEPPERLDVTYYKVAGNGPDDLYACGSGGQVLHYDGKAWSAEKTGVRSTLFTVTVAGSTVLTVGGFPAVVLQRQEGGSWQPVDEVTIGTTANGVHALGNGDVTLVGGAGAKFRRVGGTWFDDTLSGTGSDLHATWQDGTGNAFAVGGDFNSPTSAIRRGVIARFGTPVADTLEE